MKGLFNKKEEEEEDRADKKKKGSSSKTGFFGKFGKDSESDVKSKQAEEEKEEAQGMWGKKLEEGNMPEEHESAGAQQTGSSVSASKGSDTTDSTKTELERIKEEEKTRSLTDSEYQRNAHYKKGVNLMADEKLEEAEREFERATRIDPNHLDSWLKLGYCRFHLDELEAAMAAYDKGLDIDVANTEAWNLKGLIHYNLKRYDKALECQEKSIESDPYNGMAWYNKACYHSLLNQVPESIDALKRAIEVDVQNARRAVKDADFKNLRAEEGFRRMIEVVVLEAIKQGNHTPAQIIWKTMLSSKDVESAGKKLIEKGLVQINESKQRDKKFAYYELTPEVASKIGATEEKKEGGWFGKLGGFSAGKGGKEDEESSKRHLSEERKKDYSELLETIRKTKDYLIKNDDELTQKDIEGLVEQLDEFINSNKKGPLMIEQFLEDHREIRLYKIRLKDKGVDYLIKNKQKMMEMFDSLDYNINKILVGAG